MVDSIEGLIIGLEEKQSVGLASAASAVILVYESILTLHLEISLVWFSKRPYTKALYLLVRYLPFVANALVLCNHFLPNASPSTCRDIYKAVGWLYFVCLELAGSILAVRTWACWGRNKWVGISLASWMLLCQIPSGIFMYQFLDSLRFGSPPANSGANSCFVVSSNRFLWIDWLMLLIGEGASLVLMAIFVYKNSRNGDSMSLTKLICRDGLNFYIYLFCVTSINIALTLALGSEFVAIVSPIQTAIHSALTTRIILNIRRVASQQFDDFSFDLHLYDTKVPVSQPQIAFAENPASLDFDDDHENQNLGEGSMSTARNEMV